MVKQLFSEAKRDEVIEALSSMRAWQVSRGRSMTDEEKEKIRSKRNTKERTKRKGRRRKTTGKEIRKN